MQKKSPSRSGFLNSRTLMVLLVCATTVCFILIPIRSGLAFIHPQGPSNASQRTPSFEERVSYQRAIEDVYWRHRIWPKERPDPKPSLDAVMSQAQLEKKVKGYLRNSQALEDYWQRPITAEQLQAEMDRMAKHTKQPEVLQELFEALGNDPFVIAECLARPLLAERLRAHPTFEHVKETSFDPMVAASAGYTFPTISDSTGGCANDTWTPTSMINAPTARSSHTVVWTGSEMIVWGGADLFNLFNTGSRYNPSTDSWTATSTSNAPSGREFHTAVWTGSEMIVWGGDSSFPNYLNTGGKYNPTTDSWIATSVVNAPDPRRWQTAVWTGTEMIVWGGESGNPVNSGGRYNPDTDGWIATSTANAPDPRIDQTAVWTGSEMIVWGGGPYTPSNTGGRYNPSTNSWIATSTATQERSGHTAVWTGSEMIVWGGYSGGIHVNTGARYDPASNSWTPTSTTNAPDGRIAHAAVSTGSEMIVWGGYNFQQNEFFNTGGRYNPIMDDWTATSTLNTPGAREVSQATGAVWTGTEMLVWGGYDGNSLLNTGGRYCAQSGPIPTPSPTPTVSPTPATPTPTPTPTVTPTITPTPTATPRSTPTPRSRPAPHRRPTPPRQAAALPLKETR
jgi:N-acetylneuraminic acid mutarotase